MEHFILWAQPGQSSALDIQVYYGFQIGIRESFLLLPHQQEVASIRIISGFNQFQILPQNLPVLQSWMILQQNGILPHHQVCLGHSDSVLIDFVPRQPLLVCGCHLVNWFDRSMVGPNLVQR